MSFDKKYQQILETLDSILTSPRWEAEVKSFVDEYCITFIASDEESLLEHYKYYSDYCDLVDRKLQERLDEHGISKADFSEALTIFQQTSVERQKFSSLEQLFAAIDFLAFNIMCVNRNIEIESEASGEGKNKLLQCHSAPMRLKFGSEEDNIHEETRPTKIEHVRTESSLFKRSVERGLYFVDDITEPRTRICSENVGDNGDNCDMDVEEMSRDEVQVVECYQIPHNHKNGAETTVGSTIDPRTRICSESIGDNGEMDVEEISRDEVTSHQIPHNHKIDTETTAGSITKPRTCICSERVGDKGDDCEIDIEEMSRDEVQVVKSHQLPHSHNTGLETTIAVYSNYFQSVNSKKEENKVNRFSFSSSVSCIQHYFNFC